MPLANATILQAPARCDFSGKRTIFLSGTTSGEDWRGVLINSLSGFDVVFLNPDRPDWDSTWEETLSDSRWSEQVTWEMDMLEAADVVVCYFDRVSQAPITLLELGLVARSRNVIACVIEGYPKSGNVEAVCRRYSIPLVRSPESLAESVAQILPTIRKLP